MEVKISDTMPFQRCSRPRFSTVFFFLTAIGLGLNLLFLLRLKETGTRYRKVFLPRRRRLAVVVPLHLGDIGNVVDSLRVWPTTCSPLTMVNVDLVLYYAQHEDKQARKVLPEIAGTGGRCFARTVMVYGNLTDEVSRIDCRPHVLDL